MIRIAICICFVFFLLFSPIRFIWNQRKQQLFAQTGNIIMCSVCVCVCVILAFIFFCFAAPFKNICFNWFKRNNRYDRSLSQKWQRKKKRERIGYLWNSLNSSAFGIIIDPAHFDIQNWIWFQIIQFGKLIIRCEN